ncbi:uncharacterized protein LTHEOB_1665 [Lasiodiplodia theobromae]|uniref:uncharacterized protein n=1 Tax=Lasiodiplodia theobromae TaxID=45133 RepID=UPI0015C3C646|nr:uncharacterized protein LTHEOB_1665 [Lasiodiplodia theobromae]KAF4537474.1 hypothetical protein LTHEOB_1665 [Lasiodiplodia theobromae]
MLEESTPADVSEEDLLACQKFFENGVYQIYSTTTHEWIKPLLVEKAKQSTALFVVCATIQICFDDDGLSLRFHHQFERALRTFQAELSACNGVIRSSTFGAGLLLCTLSLLQGLRWTSHILCMADLYNLHGALDTTVDSDPYTHHCLEVMGIMDLPGFVLGRTTTHLGFWRRFRSAQQRQRQQRGDKEGTEVEGEENDGIEPVSGLPRSLLDLFARADEPGAETRFWLWPGGGGETDGEFVQAQLWDAWRYAGILDHRRRWRGRSAGAAREDASGAGVIVIPSTERLLFRLLSCLEAVRLGLEQPECGHLLVGNGTFYPFVMASLEFGVLDQRPAWRLALDRFCDKFLRPDRSRNVRVLLEAIGDARRRGDEAFDADTAMRAQGVEIALF